MLRLRVCKCHDCDPVHETEMLISNHNPFNVNTITNDIICFNKYFVEDQMPALKIPISVPKQKWRPKTASIWEEEENDDTEHPDYDSVFQQKAGNSLGKST
jgi:hypothetical protein